MVLDTEVREAGLAERSPRMRAGRRLRTLGRGAHHFLGLAALILLWDLSVRLGIFDRVFLSPPLEVADRLLLLARSGDLQANIAASLIRVGGGFILAAVIGISLGVLAGQIRPVGTLVLPVIEVFRPISPIAWIPLAILWFGLGHGPAWFVIFLGAFFPIVTNTYKGVMSVPLNQLRAAATCGIRGRALVRRVILPSALPDISTGLRIGLGIGWMAVIAAEFVAARSGLGYQIEVGRQTFATQSVIAGMVTIGLLGLAMNKGLEKVTQYLMPWAEDHTVGHARTM